MTSARAGRTGGVTRREGGSGAVVVRWGIEDLVIILFTAFIHASTKSARVISRGNIPRGSETTCARRYAGKFATRRDDDGDFY